MVRGAERCAGLCRLLAALLACVASAEIDAQAISDVRIEAPREFGYTVGDTVRHKMVLDLEGPYRLDTTSLPAAGRLNRWLEIIGAEATAAHDRDGVSYAITIDYQIVNAPHDVTAVTVPQQDLSVSGGANPIAVFIPEWTFRVGPVTDAEARDGLRLRPDRQPQPIAVDGRRIRLLVWTAVFACLLMYLGYRHLLLPRLNRDAYPFRTAHRSLRKLGPNPPADFRLGLRVFHAAVNQTAGQVVYSGKLGEFVAGHPEYAELKQELESFFSRSEDTFFRESEVAKPEAALRELTTLCRRCRTIERASR